MDSVVFGNQDVGAENDIGRQAEVQLVPRDLLGIAWSPRTAISRRALTFGGIGRGCGTRRDLRRGRFFGRRLAFDDPCRIRGRRRRSSGWSGRCLSDGLRLTTADEGASA